MAKSALRRCLRADGSELLGQVTHAVSFTTRLRGLLGRKGLAPDEGLLLEPCNSVHTIGMGFSIAVVFLSWENEVLNVIPEMLPGRLSPIVAKARRVLELSPAVLRDHPLAIGETLRFEPVAEATKA